ncbi:MAG: Flp pilus assembly protein CpaB [Acidobacteriota bacterium]|nr:Flp pilus assembly protein CpaB [Acidobacteriota bacterium]
MRNKRFLVVLSGAVVFGLFAAILVSRYLSNAQAYTKNLGNVVVAKVDIPLGTKLIAEQLSVVQFPQGASPDGIFDTPEKLIGRVAVTNIAAREPFTDFKLAAEGSEAGLSAVIPQGYRAMTVKVDDVMGVSGFLRPGAMVDVVVVIIPTEASTNRDPVSKVVLQNIKVLASGQNLDKPKNEREAESVKAVTLQVTPDQVEKLALAATEGKLRLVMRNATDQGDEQTKGVNKQTLLSGEHAMPAPEPGAMKSEQPKVSPVMPRPYAKPRMEMPRQEQKAAVPVPASTPQAPRNTVEVIEGAKRRNVEFP